jgi:hypothetical protein
MLLTPDPEALQYPGSKAIALRAAARRSARSCALFVGSHEDGGDEARGAIRHSFGGRPRGFESGLRPCVIMLERLRQRAASAFAAHRSRCACADARRMRQAHCMHNAL